MFFFIIAGVIIFLSVVFVGASKAGKKNNEDISHVTVPKTVVKKRQVEDRYVPARPTVVAPDEHYHDGIAERYVKITGSLGEHSDEGCYELDGVRLISHDCAYDDSEKYVVAGEKVGKLIVLGEVLSHPKFKN